MINKMKAFSRRVTGYTPRNTLRGQGNEIPVATAPSQPEEEQSDHRPAKKPKLNHTQFSLSQFETELQPEQTGSGTRPRKDSMASSNSRSDTRGPQSVQSSNTKATHANVSELRAVERTVTTSGKKRTRRPKPSNSAENPDSIEDSDPEVDLVRHPNQDSHQLCNGDELAIRFVRSGPRQAQVASALLNGTKRRVVDALTGETNGSKRLRRSSSAGPDPLAPEVSEYTKPVPLKRPGNQSASLSQKGDLARTNFSLWPKRHGVSSGPQRVIGSRELSDFVRAKQIIGPDGLTIHEAVSGQFRYPEPNGVYVSCTLRLEEISTLLFPVDQHGVQMFEHSWLDINLSSAHGLRSSNADVVQLTRATVASKSAAPQLYIRFSTPHEAKLFRQWVGLERNEAIQIKIFEESSEKLKKEMSLASTRATKGRVLRDADAAPASIDTREIPNAVPANMGAREVADDIKLVEHNHKRKLPWLHQEIQDEPPKPKLPTVESKVQDGMQASVPSDGKNSDAAPAQDPTLRHQTRPATRTTKRVRSPTPAPQKGWTEEHSDWAANWNKSLVFPAEGEGRATVDEGDIQRLDEGQFLNDNLIIFYLRYLQYNLEKNRQDIASRVYFHNTFFYDKLKPTKGSSRVNYDSVKKWTSKVDLFTKDFIVVPINEYTHWYVAIIYNAPRLLKPANQLVSQVDSSDDKHKATAAEDAKKTEEKGAGLVEASALPANDVATDLGRMSINGSALEDMKPSEVKPISDSAVPQATENGEVVELVKESRNANPAADRRRTPTSGKKSGKKPAVLRRHDPDQFRIITLDSLGSTHSPACQYLKQYLVAELKDKKGIDIDTPGAIGMTAKEIPLQANLCDCGLYLLGYIMQFLTDPDTFVRSLLQHEQIEWNLDPSDLRSHIRETVFEEQRKQQKAEDDLQSARSRARERKHAANELRDRTSRPSSSDGPGLDAQPTPSNTSLVVELCEEDDEATPAVSTKNNNFQRPSRPVGAKTEPRRSAEAMESKRPGEAQLTVVETSTPKCPPPPPSSSFDSPEPPELELALPGAFPTKVHNMSPPRGNQHRSVSDVSNKTEDDFLQPLQSPIRNGVPKEVITVDDSSQELSAPAPLMQSGKRSSPRTNVSVEVRSNDMPWRLPKRRSSTTLQHSNLHSVFSMPMSLSADRKEPITVVEDVKTNEVVHLEDSD